jgi:ketosteroid isomerase-like protein
MSITSLFPRDRSRGTPPAAATPAEPVDEIRELDQQFLTAVRAGDATWVRDRLADDALLVLGDGRRLQKSDYLQLLSTEPNRFRSLAARDVTVRAFGPTTMQVDADAPWELADGSRGVSRYIDTWVWLDGRWQVVSAQITPLPASAKG